MPRFCLRYSLGLFILCLTLLSACRTEPATTVVSASPTLPAPQAITPTPRPSEPPIPPDTPQVQVTPALTAAPALTLPVLAGTPVPIPTEPITPENVDQIRELAIWGKGRIRQVAYSSDGRILAIATEAGIWLHNAATLELLHFIRTDRWVDHFVFAADGHSITSKLGKTILAVWDVFTGEQLSEQQVSLEDHVGTNLPFSLGSNPVGGRDVPRTPLEAFSPDGKWVANETALRTVGQNEVKCILTDYHDKWESISSLTFSVDSTLLASGTSKGRIEVWEIQSCQRQRYSWANHTHKVSSLAFSPDGRHLASGSADGTVHVWEWMVEAGRQADVLEGFLPEVRDMAVSPYGQVFVSPGFDGAAYHFPHILEREIQVWDIAQGQIIQTLATGHDYGDLNLAISADGNTLASGGATTIFVRVWDTKTKELIQTIESPVNYVGEIALSPDGQKVFLGVYLYDVQTGQELDAIRLSVPGDKYTYSPKGALVAQAGVMGGGMLNIETKEVLYHFGTSGHAYNFPAFSPDGTLLALGSYDNSKLWIQWVETGEVVYELDHPPDGIGGLTFSPDGSLLASAVWQTRNELQSSIRLWDVERGILLTTLPEHTASVRRLFFSMDGKLLISGGADGTIRLWGIPPK